MRGLLNALVILSLLQSMPAMAQEDSPEPVIEQVDESATIDSSEEVPQDVSADENFQSDKVTLSDVARDIANAPDEAKFFLFFFMSAFLVFALQTPILLVPVLLGLLVLMRPDIPTEFFNALESTSPELESGYSELAKKNSVMLLLLNPFVLFFLFIYFSNVLRNLLEILVCLLLTPIANYCRGFSIAMNFQERIYGFWARFHRHVDRGVIGATEKKQIFSFATLLFWLLCLPLPKSREKELLTAIASEWKQKIRSFRDVIRNRQNAIKDDAAVVDERKQADRSRTDVFTDVPPEFRFRSGFKMIYSAIRKDSRSAKNKEHNQQPPE
jgi:hypothetical protein